ESAIRDCGRRQTRREQVPRRDTTRAQQRATRQAQHGVARCQEHRRHGPLHREVRGGEAMRSLGISVLLAIPLAAQQPKSTFDRRVVPPPAKEAELTIPTWTKATLANGAQLVVVERHTLPLVSVLINFVGGANQYEPATKTGL